MDFSLVMEVLVEKGYLSILEVCLVLLVVLVILHRVLPTKRYFHADLYVSRDKVFMEELFTIAVSITCVRKVMIKELAFFVECLIVSSEKRGISKRKSHFFKKEVIVQNLTLYPKCEYEEKLLIKVPEKNNNDEFLPGTFTNSDGKYKIIWESGYTMLLEEVYEKIEKGISLVVYPVSLKW